VSEPVPENVVRTRELSWEEWPGVRPPFGGRTKAIGTVSLQGLGLHLDLIEPGQRSCPLHDHLFEEEQFYVLQGVVTVTEREPDGARREFELHPGELVVYRAGTRLAHAFSNRGTAHAILLAFSARKPGDICTYPDSDKTNFRGRGIGAWSGRTPEKAQPVRPLSTEERLARAALRAQSEKPNWLQSEARPKHVVRTPAPANDAPKESGSRGTDLSRTGGAEQVFLHHRRVAAGCTSHELHRHRFDEEVALLLEGELSLRQIDRDGVESRTSLTAGDWVWWRPDDLAHQLLNEGAGDSEILVLSTGYAWDVIEYPEREEIFSAALGEVGQLEPLDYFAGEAD